ncbi:MAG: MvaI/BcnI restriction endonuclease family protein [Selenomonas ruminantium]|uniref:MvaI/BcnI restriction endonuclease family protein n=1 Tax=Selenomonas ruminantium TaxID=971 RepID=A0A927WJ93_SELRU|nr:MvaI/BcnI family restriction endonuclease [Selenomonas ruminantium]MBE6085776.1 MvaI/BcnI restriction endonuclease family protein [Selenomonas ruminantium]
MMLAMSDIDIQQFLPLFADLGVSVAFLVPTPNGYTKSIMDATSPVRDLLKDNHIHDYEQQPQGQDGKVIVKSYFVSDDNMTETTASLYRPQTKQGDPRIWFSNLKKYCSPCNLLALVVLNGNIYVINLSDPAVRRSITEKALVYDLLSEIAHKNAFIANELRLKIQHIHDMGFIPSITPGDPGVGDTLEHALGISRNNSKKPDYKGIELKATRLTRNGGKRQTTRATLFTKVPDEGLTYRQIVETYGKYQIPRGSTIARLQLYETFRVSRANAYDLMLEMDSNNDKLKMIYHPDAAVRKYVSGWLMQNLRSTLLQKHPETFWVKAVSENHDGKEFFRYDQIQHTKNPNVSLLAPLIEKDIITLDLAAHIVPDTGKWRDHGLLFKMLPSDLPLLFGKPLIYDLQ